MGWSCCGWQDPSNFVCFLLKTAGSVTVTPSAQVVTKKQSYTDTIKLLRSQLWLLIVSLYDWSFVMFCAGVTCSDGNNKWLFTREEKRDQWCVLVNSNLLLFSVRLCHTKLEPFRPENRQSPKNNMWKDTGSVDYLGGTLDIFLVNCVVQPFGVSLFCWTTLVTRICPRVPTSRLLLSSSISRKERKKNRGWSMTTAIILEDRPSHAITSDISSSPFLFSSVVSGRWASVACMRVQVCLRVSQHNGWPILPFHEENKRCLGRICQPLLWHTPAHNLNKTNVLEHQQKGNTHVLEYVYFVENMCGSLDD